MKLVSRLGLGLALTAAALSLFMPTIAAADVTVADLHESLDLPDFATGAYVLQNLGVTFPSAAPQLTAANVFSNPNAYQGVLDIGFDSTTNIITLTPDSLGDIGYQAYQTIDIQGNNLVMGNGQQVIGITPVVTNQVATVGTLLPSINATYTGTSFEITYNVPLGNNDFFLIGENGPAADEFLLTLSPEIIIEGTPEPGSLALLFGVSATGVATLLRKRRASR